MRSNDNVFSSQVLASEKHKGRGYPLSNLQQKNIPHSQNTLAPRARYSRGLLETWGSNPSLDLPQGPQPAPRPPALPLPPLLRETSSTALNCP